jgi:hypothetical protein
MTSESLYFFQLNVLWRRTSACNKDNVSVLNNLYRKKIGFLNATFAFCFELNKVANKKYSELYCIYGRNKAKDETTLPIG